MFNKLREQTSQFLITAIISLIIIGFMFTGYQSFQGTPDTVAEVAGEKISYREYKTALDQQIQFFSSQFGGTPLTNKQIEQFQLKQRTIDNLVSQKLLKVLGDELNIPVSKEQIIKTVKEIPAFKNGEQFDVSRYKQLLAANRLTPSTFEASIADGITSDASRNLLNKAYLSKDLINKILDIQKNSKEVDIIKINKNNLKKQITVTTQEIKQWLKEERNTKKVADKFMQEKSFKYDQKEQVKASHILMRTDDNNQKEILKKMQDLRKKLTTKNFAKLANKHSMDPSNQGKKGGALNWFSRKSMVPEFEKVAFTLKPGKISDPVKTSYGYHIIYIQDKKDKKQAKLEDHQTEIAREIIQNSADKRLEELFIKTQTKIKALLEQNNQKKLKKMAEINQAITLHISESINLYDKNPQLSSLTSSELKGLFNQQNGSIKTYSTAIQETVVHVKGSKTDPKISYDSVKLSIEGQILRKKADLLLKKLREIYPPKVMSNRL